MNKVHDEILDLGMDIQEYQIQMDFVPRISESKKLI